MDRKEIEKNVLDIEERNHRNRFTTQITLSFTVLFALIAMLAVPDFHDYSLLIWIAITVSVFFIHDSLKHKKKADQKLEEIKKL